LGDLCGPIHGEALNNEVNFHYQGTSASISIDETTQFADIETLVRVFAKVKGKTIHDIDLEKIATDLSQNYPKNGARYLGRIWYYASLCSYRSGGWLHASI